MGVNFADVLDGPDLLQIVKEVNPESIPQDVRSESLNGIAEEERARRGDWLAIWGGMFLCLSTETFPWDTRLIRTPHRLGNISKPDHPTSQTRRPESRNRGGQCQTRPADIEPQVHPPRFAYRQPRPPASHSNLAVKCRRRDSIRHRHHRQGHRRPSSRGHHQKPGQWLRRYAAPVTSSDTAHVSIPCLSCYWPEWRAQGRPGGGGGNALGAYQAVPRGACCWPRVGDLAGAAVGAGSCITTGDNRHRRGAGKCEHGPRQNEAGRD